MKINNVNIESYLEMVTGKVPDLKFMQMDHVQGLSLHLRKSYELYHLKLLDRDLILVQPHKADPLSPTQALKILKVFRTNLKQEVVMVLNKLPAYLRSRYIAHQIPFIVPGQQLFIPQMLIDLNNNKEHRQVERSFFRPATQCMILYHLIKEYIEELSQDAIAEKLGYSSMTISRAVKECEDKGIVVKKSGINFISESKQLWVRSKDYLQSPVRKVVYTDRITQLNNKLKSGMTALSYYTDLAANSELTFAISKDQYKTLQKMNIEFNDRYGQAKIEVWEYAPTILTSNEYVDRLSLFLSLRGDNNDARTSKALDNLINQVYD